MRQIQSYSLATGCKFDENSEAILSKCLVALAPGTGYGSSDIKSSLDEDTIYGSDYNYSRSASTPVSPRLLLVTSSKVSNTSYTEAQVRQAVAGRSISKGGLNVKDMKHVLDWNNVTYTSGSSRVA